jgi:hypothetical protein
MQGLAAAYQLAQAINSTSQDSVRVEAQKAIDEMLLPAGDTTEQYVDAAAILQERAYTDEQIGRLAKELGEDLKTENEGRSLQYNQQEFDRKQIGLYHRVRDASLIEDVLASFKLRCARSHCK